MDSEEKHYDSVAVQKEITMNIGVLAIQGAFAEHEQKLTALGADVFEIRQAKDLQNPMDGLILPGGESTVMGKLLHDLDLFNPLHKRIKEGLPVMGTCAGLILLAKQLADDDVVHFATMPVEVKRNAYGRQLGSFHTTHEMKGIGMIPMNFIRPPYVTKCTDEVEILAQVDEKIVAVQYKNQLGLAFHPEVTDCDKVHAYFLDMCQKR